MEASTQQSQTVTVDVWSSPQALERAVPEAFRLWASWYGEPHPDRSVHLLACPSGAYAPSKTGVAAALDEPRPPGTPGRVSVVLTDDPTARESLWLLRTVTRLAEPQLP